MLEEYYCSIPSKTAMDLEIVAGIIIIATLMKVGVTAIITSICFPLEDTFMKSARPDCEGQGQAGQEAI